MPIIIEREDSLARLISALLGRAKNVDPKALTKQASAKPPVNANEPAAKIKIQVIYDDSDVALKNSD